MRTARHRPWRRGSGGEEGNGIQFEFMISGTINLISIGSFEFGNPIEEIF
jgi:hypothetical protein